MGEQNLIERIQALDEEQLKLVYSRLLLHFDPSEEVALTTEEVEARVQRDQAFLKAVAYELDLSPLPAETEHEAAEQALIALINAVPEVRAVVEEAITEVEAEALTLDMVVIPTIALYILVTATAAAIVRPRVTWEEKKTADGSVERKIDVQAQGVDDVSKVIRAIFPFLGKSG